MQIDTNAALITVLISAVIAFGLAFYIERKLSGGVQKKSQKILISIAMMSFGYGLMMTLNEVIGFPLQGLQIRYDKLAVSIVANIIILPIVLMAIAKLIGMNNKTTDVNSSFQSNIVAASFFKYFLMLAGALSVAYFGYVAVEGSTSPSGAIYDFYERVDQKNCYSQYGDKPDYSLRFTFKKETNEIFVTVEANVDGVKKMQIQTLDNCSVLDSKNWTCGGKWTGSYLSPKYMYVDGVFSYMDGQILGATNCSAKYIKR